MAALEKEFPRLRIVHKEDDAFSRLVDRALRVVTLGGQSAYMSRYVTTMGSTIYVPESWDERDDVSKYVTLRHEAVHLRQFRRYGRPLMTILYLLPILPLGLALGRARLEWEAYSETLRATAEARGVDAARDEALHAYIVSQFTGPAYGWMWPFPRQVRRWIAQTVSEIERGAAPPRVKA